MNADRIYVLERGRIVETGTHRELVDLKGLYYAMWRQQIGERKSAAPGSESGAAGEAAAPAADLANGNAGGAGTAGEEEPG